MKQDLIVDVQRNCAHDLRFCFIQQSVRLNGKVVLEEWRDVGGQQMHKEDAATGLNILSRIIRKGRCIPRRIGGSILAGFSRP